MKDMVIATLIVILLIGGWLVFIHYADGESQAFQREIKESILPDIQAENWGRSVKQLEELSRNWHKFRKISLLFLDTNTISEIDYGLAKSIMYARAEDVSNSTGELSAMVEQLSFLTGNESLSLQNIF